MADPVGTPTTWFQLVQTFGIITSLLLAAYAALRSDRALRLSNYLKLTENHRAIWRMTMEKDSGLERITMIDPALASARLTSRETQFLSFLFIHISTTYELQKSKHLVKINLRYDVREMFRQPIVLRFWEENKRYHNDDFVKFMDGLVPTTLKQSLVKDTTHQQSVLPSS